MFIASMFQVLKYLHSNPALSLARISGATMSSNNVTRTKVSLHMHLHALKPSPIKPLQRGKERSLVIMFPFLRASPSVISHYCDLYHKHGYNVLTVTGTLKHFLWPAAGFTLAREVLDYLSSNELPLSTSRFYIHGFSIGAYIYTLVMMELAKGKIKYASITPKIKAQVFDSLVIGGFDSMSTGITVIKNPIVKSLTHGLFSTYLMLTKRHTKDVLEQAIEHFKHHPIRSPILLYYCLNDPMSKPEAVQEMLNTWQQEYKLDIHVKCWERSIHAGHFQAHPDQYSRTLDAFLTHVQKQSLVHPSKIIY